MHFSPRSLEAAPLPARHNIVAQTSVCSRFWLSRASRQQSFSSAAAAPHIHATFAMKADLKSARSIFLAAVDEAPGEGRAQLRRVGVRPGTKP